MEINDLSPTSTPLSEGAKVTTSGQWKGRIVQNLPGKHTSNPIVKKVLEIGKIEFLSQFTFDQVSKMTKGQKQLKKIELGLQKLSETRIKLTKDELLELQAIAQKAFDSEEMSKQDTGFLGIPGLIRQLAVESGVGDYAAQQKDLQTTFLSIKENIKDLEKAIAIRPKLIKSFEKQMTKKVKKFFRQLKNREISHTKLNQKREALFKQLESSDGWGTLEETQGLLALRRKLEQSIIPSPGAHARFQQARYDLEFGLLFGKNTKIMNKLATHLKSSLQDSNEHFEMDKEAIKSLLKAQLEDINTEMTKTNVTISYKKKIKDSIEQEPHLYPSEPTLNGEPKSLAKHFYILNKLMRNMGVIPTKRVFFENENVKNVTEQIKEMALSKNTVSIILPNHAVLIVTDPERGIFRFYDPNNGLYRFDDSSMFAACVSRHINRYNKAEQPVFDINDNVGDNYPVIMQNHMEVPISQSVGRGMTGDLGLGAGICAALCNHVGRFFLEHPNVDDRLTAEMLGLSEFNEIQIREEKAKIFIDQKKYTEARIEYYLLLNMIPNSKRDRELDRIIEDQGIYSAIRYASEKDYMGNPASLGFEQTSLLFKILHIMDLENKAKTQQTSSENTKEVPSSENSSSNQATEKPIKFNTRIAFTILGLQD